MLWRLASFLTRIVDTIAVLEARIAEVCITILPNFASWTDINSSFFFLLGVPFFKLFIIFSELSNFNPKSVLLLLVGEL